MPGKLEYGSPVKVAAGINDRRQIAGYFTLASKTATLEIFWRRQTN
jgi:hypothetical protein